MEKSLRYTTRGNSVALGTVKQYRTARKRKYYQRLLVLKKNMTFRQRMFVLLLWQKLGLLVTETFIVALVTPIIQIDIVAQLDVLLMWCIKDIANVDYSGVRKSLYLKKINKYNICAYFITGQTLKPEWCEGFYRSGRSNGIILLPFVYRS